MATALSCHISGRARVKAGLSLSTGLSRLQSEGWSIRGVADGSSFCLVTAIGVPQTQVKIWWPGTWEDAVPSSLLPPDALHAALRHAVLQLGWQVPGTTAHY